MGKHLVFYDGNCGLCDNIVQFLLWADKGKQFLFAPLQGGTAEEVLKALPVPLRGQDSLVLVENFHESAQRFYILGRGAFRIFWLLGSWWKLIGWINFLPPFLYNWLYRLIARNRHYIFRQDRCELPTPENKTRFLP